MVPLLRLAEAPPWVLMASLVSMVSKWAVE